MAYGRGADEHPGIRHRNRAGRGVRPRACSGSKGLSDDEVGKAMQARARQDIGQRFPAARAASHRRHLLRVPLARGIPGLEPGRRERAGTRAACSGSSTASSKYHARARELERRRLRPAGAALPRAASPGAARRATGKPATKTHAFRYNNYLGRFHWRHIDRHGRAVGLPGAARASLSDTARAAGLPGQARIRRFAGVGRLPRGELTRIRRYCETDVINTWLIFLRFQHMRGRLTDAGLAMNWRARAPGSPRPNNRTSTNSSPPGSAEA